MTSSLVTPSSPTTPPAPRRGFRAVSVLALAAALAAGPVAPAFLAPAPAQAQARGLESLAPLAEQVMDAVVNISASTTAEARQVPLPQVPPGSPFEDFFNDFFNRDGGEDGARPNPGPGARPNQPRRQQRSSSLGSGFVIDASGIVVTNNHVIGEANDVSVILQDGTKLKAEVLGKDAKIDIAVLRVKPDKPLKAVKFGDSDVARVGDWVIAIGNPFGFGGSLSAGVVSARNRNIGSGPYDSFIQTDAAINKGNSGGPLFNMAGEVIGINTAIVSPSGGSIGIGFSVPSNVASAVVDQLRQFGETRRGWLGVRIQDVDDAIAEGLGLKGVRGALVAGVDERGPAKPAGIEAGDVITRFDGRDIKESRDLPRIVAGAPVGKAVPVTVVRKGQELTKTVTLGRLEDGEKLASAARPGAAEGERPAARRNTAGMDLGPITPEARRRLNIKEGVKGVLIGRVDPDSSAGQKRIQAGDVLVEVAQEPVNTPAEVQDRVEKLRKEGKKTALLLVSNAGGDLRFVAVNID